MAVKFKSKSKPAASDDTPEIDVPEVESVDTPEEVQVDTKPEVEIPAVIAQPVVPSGKVKISVFRTIDPSPRIGNFSFTADMNMPVLKPGNYEVPFNVAAVLVDRNVAQFS